VRETQKTIEGNWTRGGQEMKGRGGGNAKGSKSLASGQRDRRRGNKEKAWTTIEKGSQKGKDTIRNETVVWGRQKKIGTTHTGGKTGKIYNACRKRATTKNPKEREK